MINVAIAGWRLIPGPLAESPSVVTAPNRFIKLLQLVMRFVVAQTLGNRPSGCWVFGGSSSRHVYKYSG